MEVIQLYGFPILGVPGGSWRFGSISCESSANAVSAALPDHYHFACEPFGNRTNSRFISHEHAILLRTSDHGHSRTTSVIINIDPDVSLSLKTASGNFTNFPILIGAFLFRFVARRFDRGRGCTTSSSSCRFATA